MVIFIYVIILYINIRLKSNAVKKMTIEINN